MGAHPRGAQVHGRIAHLQRLHAAQPQPQPQRGHRLRTGLPAGGLSSTVLGGFGAVPRACVPAWRSCPPHHPPATARLGTHRARQSQGVSQPLGASSRRFRPFSGFSAFIGGSVGLMVRTVGLGLFLVGLEIHGGGEPADQVRAPRVLRVQLTDGRRVRPILHTDEQGRQQ